MFVGVAPLQPAEPDEVSFRDNRCDSVALEQTMADAAIVHPQMQAWCSQRHNSDRHNRGG
jgi:UDP-3-O-[3-hydroxymyristoyl] glucosamine N-acyltransferase